MVDYLQASWTIGGNVSFIKKSITKFSKTIPKLYLNVKTDQDLTDYSVRAYFKKPDFVYNTDVAILETELIEDGKVIFDLEGSKLAELGTWTIELVLVDNTTENLGATTEISYTVIQNVEGSEGDFVIGSDTTNTVGELVLQLEEASATANASAIEAEAINSDLAETIVEANATNDTLSATIVSGNTTNDNILSSIETANTAIETIATDSENAILLTEQLMTNLQTDYTTASSNIDAKTARSIELIETDTNVALEAIDSIPAEVEKITDELEKVDPAILLLSTELDKVDPAITSLDAKLDEVDPAIVLLDAKLDEVPAEIQNITDEGTTQFNIVRSEGMSQVSLVEAKGDDEIELVEAAGTTQIGLLADANEGYIRDVESDSEEVLTVTEQLMENLNEDYVSDRNIINAQTARSIELINQATNEALETIRKIKEGL